jgi:hypothetical protein
VTMDILCRTSDEISSNRNVLALDAIIQNSKDFTAIFSFFPFLILACNFLQATGYIIGQLAESANMDEKVQTLTISAIFLSYFVVLARIVSRRHEEEMEKVNRIVLKIRSKSNITVNDMSFIQMIERVVQKEKVWFICDIDQSLFVYYLGHLVSFSALFFQFFNESK